MKHRVLALQSVVFATSCYCVAVLVAVAVRFPAGRLLFSIVLALICVVAEIFSGYLVLRQLWRWSARVASALLMRKQEMVTAAAATDTRIDTHITERPETQS
jgi:uncharacterized protein YacL